MSSVHPARLSENYLPLSYSPVISNVSMTVG